MINSVHISLIGEFDFLRIGSITRSKGINKGIYLNTFNIWRGSVILKSLILFLFIESSKLGLVVCACNSFTQEAEAGGLFWVWEQPGLHIYKLSYKANLCHKHQTTKTNKSSSLISTVSSVYWKKKEKGHTCPSAFWETVSFFKFQLKNYLFISEAVVHTFNPFNPATLVRQWGWGRSTEERLDHHYLLCQVFPIFSRQAKSPTFTCLVHFI